MVEIKVKVYGHLQDLFKKKEFEVDLPNESTLEVLITRIGKLYGKDIEKELQPKESASVSTHDYRGQKRPSILSWDENIS